MQTTKNIPAKIGIVTVTYNSATVLNDFLLSLAAQTFSNWILYVVDNASTDTTLAQLSAWQTCNPTQRIVVIANTDNKGVAAGNNQGINAATADGCTHTLLLNNDTVFETTLLEYLLQGQDEYYADITVPKILYYDQPQKIWCAGGYFSARNIYCGSIYGMNKPDGPKYDLPRKIEYDATCCMLIKQQVFQNVGLMDESYFVYYDDTDWCFRANKIGTRMFYIPKARLLHKVSSLTKGDDSPFSTRHMVRNRVYFIRKNIGGAFGQFGLFAIRTWHLVSALASTKSRAKLKLRKEAFEQGLKMTVRNDESV